MRRSAAAEAACAGGRRAVLGIEQPFVGPEGTVEPQGMIEAGGLDRAVEDAAAMGDQGRIRAASCRRHRRARIDGWRDRRAACRWRESDTLNTGCIGCAATIAVEFHRSQLDRPLALVIGAHRGPACAA